MGLTFHATRVVRSEAKLIFGIEPECILDELTKLL